MPFLSTIKCPVCARQYVVVGKAPALQGHQPYYFAGDCGHRIMAVVPQDAKVECVEDPLAD
jgi:hypothetical protein